MPILRVAAPVCEEDAVNLIVKGEFTDLKRAMGKAESSELPTVYVPGDQEDMRVSEGCIRSWLTAFRKPFGL